MKTQPKAARAKKRPSTSSALAKVRQRLAEAEEALIAMRSGEVDSVFVAGEKGKRQVFTLKGTEQAYRVIIEYMNEGALTLTTEKMILYANQRFAQMVKCPLEQVIGGSFKRFLSASDRATLRPLMKRAAKTGATILATLIAMDGTKIPAQLSIRLLPRNGFDGVTIGMVVTDLTEARRTEELLRQLTQRTVTAQEIERGRVALELHDGITQLLCAVNFQSQALVAKLAAIDERNSDDEGPLKDLVKSATSLRASLGETAEEVERITRNLRPSVLENLGLVAAFRETCSEFSKRTGAHVELQCNPSIMELRLPADAELALFRVLQEALRNVEKHAKARNVKVGLSKQGDALKLTINDDGVGFDTHPKANRRKSKGGLGLLGMSERAAFVGGEFSIKSTRAGPGVGSGTEVEVRMQLSAKGQ